MITQKSEQNTSVKSQDVQTCGTWPRMSPTLTRPDYIFTGEGSGATALSGTKGTFTTLGLMQALKPGCICFLHVHWAKKELACQER